MPESPRGRIGAIGASARYLSTPIVTSWPSIGGLIFSPCFRRISGLGSNRSSCDGPPWHEQEDHPLRPRGEVRCASRERARRCPGEAAHHRLESHGAEAARGGAQQLPAIAADAREGAGVVMADLGEGELRSLVERWSQTHQEFVRGEQGMAQLRPGAKLPGCGGDLRRRGCGARRGTRRNRLRSAAVIGRLSTRSQRASSRASSPDRPLTRAGELEGSLLQEPGIHQEQGLGRHGGHGALAGELAGLREVEDVAHLGRDPPGGRSG